MVCGLWLYCQWRGCLCAALCEGWVISGCVGSEEFVSVQLLMWGEFWGEVFGCVASGEVDLV